MSAPLRLSSSDVRDLAAALDGLTKLTRQYGVGFNPYGDLRIQVSDSVLAVTWDEDAEEYVVQDRNGS